MKYNDLSDSKDKRYQGTIEIPKAMKAYSDQRESERNREKGGVV